MRHCLDIVARYTCHLDRGYIEPREEARVEEATRETSWTSCVTLSSVGE